MVEVAKEGASDLHWATSTCCNPGWRNPPFDPTTAICFIFGTKRRLLTCMADARRYGRGVLF